MEPESSKDYSASPGLVLFVLFLAVMGVFGSSLFGFSLFQGGLAQMGLMIGAVYLVTFLDIRAGFAALVFAVGFSPEFAIGPVNNLRFEDFIMPVLLLSWLSRATQNRQPFEPTPLNLPILAILTAGTLSSVLGAVQGYVEPLYTAFRLGKFFEYYCIYWLFLNNTRTRRDFNALVAVVLVIGLAASVGAILGAYRGGGAEPDRAGGPEGEGANIFGGYLMIVCALNMGMFISAKTGRSRLFHGVGILASFWAMMLTYSRTSYVALVLGMLAVALLRRRAIFGWVMILAIIFSALMPESVVDRARTILDVFGENRPSSWNARIAGWQGLSHKIVSDPLLGRGVGVIGLSDADNEYMLQLVQSGVLGLGLFLWFIWRQMRICLETEQVTKGDPLAEGFATGSSLAIVCLAIHGLGATSFTSIRTMEQLMVVAGLVGALHNRWPEWKPGMAREAQEGPSVPRRPLIRSFVRPGASR